ncbi:MAG: DUF6428 family protein [Flavobacteriales bacterium]|nr:DUF6428 family protein [Flavobacteriales bacterium]
MLLSEFKNLLQEKESIEFILPNGQAVPKHFHITEIGIVNKTFIDCGGTIREEKIINFQLWTSIDFYHRLKPSKLVSIIQIAQDRISLEDCEIEIEYQGDTIGKYTLDFVDEKFHLVNTKTACLAEDACGVPVKKIKKTLQDLKPSINCCDPDSGCC